MFHGGVERSGFTCSGGDAADGSHRCRARGVHDAFPATGAAHRCDRHRRGHATTRVPWWPAERSSAGADNGQGQLGNGRTPTRALPSMWLGSPGATAISWRHIHTCAVVAGGAVKCWGDNAYGELGNGTNTESWHTGRRDRCFRCDRHRRRRPSHLCRGGRWGGQVLGQQRSGQLGNGTTTISSTAVDVTGVVRCDRRHRGQRVHRVRCWPVGRSSAGADAEHSSTRPRRSM